ncbi:hypothetical protein Val02_01410 [Virgisporangium aliadipatigenens]|uniref:Uncharacterized protein n=1 Tax=Virgisporangium aliadipatigenens TaxID=741659 RepID=A0A8J4DLZ9_9ACTN|nr:hypothetical protein [Virgisporangium aliadipatigenens]GIJ43255.1 hypothetical protein Val02_01410 [Virgisporangium aliadipatigenens]
MEFRILGPLQVWNGPGRVVLGGAQQARVLAALLLAPDRVVPPDTPTVTDGPGHRLSVERTQLDAAAFRHHAGSGDPERALGLRRGPATAGIDGTRLRAGVAADRRLSEEDGASVVPLLTPLAGKGVTRTANTLP